MLRRVTKVGLDLRAVNNQRALEPKLAELLCQRLRFVVLQTGLVEHDDAAILSLRRQRVLERECTNLLWQIERVAAHHRSESAAAATELRYACGAVACATGALLRIHFLARAPDFTAVFGLVCAALASCQLTQR